MALRTEPSDALRTRVAKLRDRGASCHSISRRLGVPVGTVQKASAAGRPAFVRPPVGTHLRDAVPFMQQQRLTPPRIAEVLGVELDAVRPFLVDVDGGAE